MSLSNLSSTAELKSAVEEADIQELLLILAKQDHSYAYLDYSPGGMPNLVFYQDGVSPNIYTPKDDPELMIHLMEKFRLTCFLSEDKNGLCWARYGDFQFADVSSWKAITRASAFAYILMHKKDGWDD